MKKVIFFLLATLLIATNATAYMDIRAAMTELEPLILQRKWDEVFLALRKLPNETSDRPVTTAGLAWEYSQYCKQKTFCDDI